ncbi:MAG: hypothetical protein JWN03_2756 [Nocardia sp.]|nr:hypothetical protein [Nocardia sp.]
MVDGRRWRAAAYRTLVVEHPVLGPVAQQLVWATFDAADMVTGSFRIANDHTLLDVDGESLELPADGLIGVAHPLPLGTTLEQWRGLFAREELRQPFDQLDRSLYRFTPEEAAADQLTRFVNRRVPTGRIYGVQQQGWELSHTALYRRFTPKREVTVTLTPGIQGGYRYQPDEQHIVSVQLRGGEFGIFDAITASELLRQLERLAA